MRADFGPAEKAAYGQHVHAQIFFSHAPTRHCGASATPSFLREEAKGALEAGAPEFIDLITSENAEYQVSLGGGLMWLDNTCIDRYEKVYLESSPEQQKEILDLIAYARTQRKIPVSDQGIEFFASFVS